MPSKQFAGWHLQQKALDQYFSEQETIQIGRPLASHRTDDIPVTKANIKLGITWNGSIDLQEPSV